ncbi:MAG: HD domain-containing protein [Kiloniellaceae bacterium]
MDAVNFTQMKDGTKAEYEFLTDLVYDHHKHTADRLLEALAALEDGISGYQVTRLGHSLQSATRAYRDGADIDWIVMALLHDIGDTLAPFSHSDYAASIIKPFVREQVTWVTRFHGEFQMYYYGHLVEGFDRMSRERHRGHLYFDDCVEFCERWDQNCFDPAYDTLPLDFFEPMVREVFARHPYDPAVLRVGEREPLVKPAAA